MRLAPPQTVVPTIHQTMDLVELFLLSIFLIIKVSLLSIFFFIEARTINPIIMKPTVIQSNKSNFLIHPLFVNYFPNLLRNLRTSLRNFYYILNINIQLSSEKVFLLLWNKV